MFALVKEYKEGQDSIKDNHGKCAKPTIHMEDNIKLLKALINDDNCETIQDLAWESGLSAASVHVMKILTSPRKLQDGYPTFSQMPTK